MFPSQVGLARFARESLHLALPMGAGATGEALALDEASA
jgi:hypothetical protein